MFQSLNHHHGPALHSSVSCLFCTGQPSAGCSTQVFPNSAKQRGVITSCASDLSAHFSSLQRSHLHSATSQKLPALVIMGDGFLNHKSSDSLQYSLMFRLLYLQGLLEDLDNLFPIISDAVQSAYHLLQLLSWHTDPPSSADNESKSHLSPSPSQSLQAPLQPQSCDLHSEFPLV